MNCKKVNISLCKYNCLKSFGQIRTVIVIQDKDSDARIKSPYSDEWWLVTDHRVMNGG